MARTVEEIVANASELAKRFENYEPKPGEFKAPVELNAVRKAYEAVGKSQGALSQAISEARDTGFSWAQIGVMVGTSGEAARQKYGTTEKPKAKAKKAVKKVPKRNSAQGRMIAAKVAQTKAPKRKIKK